MSQNYDEFRRSLDELVHQAQRTAQLGLDVAKDQVETLVQNRGNLNDQMDEVRRNLQTMAREMESRAQELVHMATSAMQHGPMASGTYTRPAGGSPSSNPASAPSPTPEAPTGSESHTGAGAGTPQEGSDHTESTPTPNGEAPRQ